MTSVRIDYADFAKLAPGVMEGLGAIGKAVGGSGLGKDLIELIKLRASQLNGCAFCLQYHLNLARSLHVPADKLDQLAAWHEAPVFSPRERLALAYAEQLTLSAQGAISDELFAQVLAEFGPADLSVLTASVAHINAWNRIGKALRFTPPAPRQEHQQPPAAKP
ncbi:carboxymuconolactone decarboxylase family protein [Paucibacter sp. KCTC 42545]|uniref:carboxymuconolactone decarboxylase family protein n=1 Tax=Paucibacter sp. KCTC 42545 TaxID=1768242 RepID=UPI000733C271|nr:carboxymuconolactone decarboxylase family protein [Paucibacter sp. KCTC 42545]ALT77964.1 alkylhydroperoxidase [Paucibacter sp. KCTC 42545]